MATHFEKELHQVPGHAKGASKHHSQLHRARAQDHWMGADWHSLRRLQSSSPKSLLLSAVRPGARLLPPRSASPKRSQWHRLRVLRLCRLAWRAIAEVKHRWAPTSITPTRWPMALAVLVSISKRHRCRSTTSVIWCYQRCIRSLALGGRPAQCVVLLALDEVLGASTRERLELLKVLTVPTSVGWLTDRAVLSAAV